MNGATTPEQRARALVGVAAKVRGGPWFVQLRELADPPVWLGPYPNKSVAQEDAERVQAFLAAVIRAAGSSAPSTAEEGKAAG